MPQFHETLMGRKFYESDFPSAVKALEAIAKHLEHTNDVEKKAQETSVNSLISTCKDEVRSLLENKDDERLCRLAEIIAHEMATDDEDPYCSSILMLKAYLMGSVDEFLMALCGWSMRSLLAKAGLISDTEGVIVDTPIDVRKVAEDIAEELKGFEIEEDSSVYEIATERFVEVCKTTGDGTEPLHYSICCHFEDGDVDWQYTVGLSLEGLEKVLRELATLKI